MMRVVLLALMAVFTFAPVHASSHDVFRARANYDLCLSAITVKESTYRAQARRIVVEPQRFMVVTIPAQDQAITVVCDGTRGEMVVVRRPRA